MFDVLIIGSGPAGFTASIYAARANLKTAIIAGETWGGQLMLTTLVENFPGFPDGVEGFDLMNKMRKQAENFGVEIFEENFVEADFLKKPPFIIKTDKNKYRAKAVIIATGASNRWLDVPGEKERIGRGVSTCAPCDGPFFRNKNIVVVGGGDCAMEEAIVMTRFAKHVSVIHRRDSFKASSIMLQKAKDNEKIDFILNSQILEILGDQKVEKVKILTHFKEKVFLKKSVAELAKFLPRLAHGHIIEKGKDSIVWELPIDGVFVAVGHMPNSAVFKGIKTSEQGYIVVNERMETNIEGVFVAGDVCDTRHRQAIVAAGSGCKAALEVQHWLEQL